MLSAHLLNCLPQPDIDHWVCQRDMVASQKHSVCQMLLQDLETTLQINWAGWRL